jgi:hypothetical protein
MTLGNHRIAPIGETPYPWEKKAIDFAIEELPNSDPFHLCTHPRGPRPARTGTDIRKRGGELTISVMDYVAG